MQENIMVLPEYEYKRRYSDEDLAELEDRAYEDYIDEQLGL